MNQNICIQLKAFSAVWIIVKKWLWAVSDPRFVFPYFPISLVCAHHSIRTLSSVRFTAPLRCPQHPSTRFGHHPCSVASRRRPIEPQNGADRILQKETGYPKTKLFLNENWPLRLFWLVFAWFNTTGKIGILSWIDFVVELPGSSLAHTSKPLIPFPALSAHCSSVTFSI